MLNLATQDRVLKIAKYVIVSNVLPFPHQYYYYKNYFTFISNQKPQNISVTLLLYQPKKPQNYIRPLSWLATNKKWSVTTVTTVEPRHPCNLLLVSHFLNCHHVRALENPPYIKHSKNPGRILKAYICQLEFAD